VIGARLRYTEVQQKEILDHFIAGGSLTAGGIMQAVTSAPVQDDFAFAAWQAGDVTPLPVPPQACGPADAFRSFEHIRSQKDLGANGHSPQATPGHNQLAFV
jgi:hypothetical protein